MFRVRRIQDEETPRVNSQEHGQHGPSQTPANSSNSSVLVNRVLGSPSNRTAPEMMDKNDGHHAVASSSNAAPESPAQLNAIPHNPTQQPSA
jgi:hypothetical protein